MNRRQFVAWAGSAATIGLAGCSAVDPESPGGVVLTHVELGNAAPEPRVFDVLVEHDDEVVHWDAHEVDPGGGDGEIGGEVIEVDAPEEPGSVEVSVRVGEQWERTDFDDGRYDGERVLVSATYGWPEPAVLRLSRLESERPTSVGG